MQSNIRSVNASLNAFLAANVIHEDISRYVVFFFFHRKYYFAFAYFLLSLEIKVTMTY